MCGDVVESSLVEKEIGGRLDDRAKEFAVFFSGRPSRYSGFLRSRTHFVEALRTNYLANRLLGVKELVDVSLRKANCVGQIRDRLLPVTEMLQLFARTPNDLFPNSV